MKALPSPRRTPRKPLPASLSRLVAIPEIAARPEPPSTRPVLLPVDGDELEPLFSAGDYVLAVPTATYQGHGLYVVESERGARSILRVERAGDTSLRLTGGDVEKVVSRGVFSAIVRGKVAARVTPRDLALFRQLFRVGGVL